MKTNDSNTSDYVVYSQTYCSYCYGYHHLDTCPFKEKPLGWRCPECGVVYSPYVEYCDKHVIVSVY